MDMYLIRKIVKIFFIMLFILFNNSAISKEDNAYIIKNDNKYEGAILYSGYVCEIYKKYLIEYNLNNNIKEEFNKKEDWEIIDNELFCKFKNKNSQNYIIKSPTKNKFAEPFNATYSKKLDVLYIASKDISERKLNEIIKTNQENLEYVFKNSGINLKLNIVEILIANKEDEQNIFEDLLDYYNNTQFNNLFIDFLTNETLNYKKLIKHTGADMIVFVSSEREIGVMGKSSDILGGTTYNKIENGELNKYLKERDYGNLSLHKNDNIGIVINQNFDTEEQNEVFLFPHEFGHLLGSNHDIKSDNGVNYGTYRFSKGIGCLGSSKDRVTMMAYETVDIINCSFFSKRVPYFSSPDIDKCGSNEYEKFPCGKSKYENFYDSADMVSTIKVTLPQLLNFRHLTGDKVRTGDPSNLESEIFIGTKHDDTIITNGGDDKIFASFGNNNIVLFNNTNITNKETIYPELNCLLGSGEECYSEIYNASFGDKIKITDGYEYYYNSSNKILSVYNESHGNYTNINNPKSFSIKEIEENNEFSTYIEFKNNDNFKDSNNKDYLFGNQDNEHLFGGGGSDFLWGNGGDDVLLGGYGSDTLNGGDGSDIINGGLGSNTIKSGADNDAVFSRGNDDVYLGDGNDIYYNSIEQQGTLYVYENEGTETIYTCALSTEKLLSNCSYDFNEYVTQKIIIHYNRDESIENYYKENHDLILEIGTKNKFVFKDAFLEDRIQYDITYQDGSLIDWNQLKILADIPEENRNVLKDGDYFEIFDESDNGTYYVPEGAVVTFGEYRSGDIFNNGSIKINNLNRNLEALGNGSIDVISGNSSFLRFNNGDVNISGYFYTREITAKNINYNFIKNDSIFTSSKIADKIYGSVVLNNVENHNYYLGYRNYIYGSFELKKDANLMSQRYGSYTTRRSSNLYIYGASYFKGNIYENEVVNGSKRSILNITLSDHYSVNNEIIKGFYLYDEIDIDSITGILSLNVFDLNAIDSEIIKKFNSITHPVNGDNITINKNLSFKEYKNGNTLFNVINNAVLTIKDYHYGKFNIENGSEVSINKVLRNLNASGDGLLSIEYINYRENVIFPSGKIIFKGHNTGKSNIKAKTIIFDYVKKTEGKNYQYIYGALEGDIIVRNSLADSDYRVLGELTIRGGLTIEENVLATTYKKNSSSSQIMKVYGRLINNGEFNNIDRIDDLVRRDLNLSLYDYVVDGELVQKAYFNDGAFNKIKGNLSIYSDNIYDYNLSDLDIFNYFENGTNEIVIDKDLTLANYGGSLTNFNVKNGVTLTIKSYIRGGFHVEEGAKLIIEGFGPYAGTLDVSGSGVLEVKNMGYRESVVFPNGKVILGGDVRRANVKAETIVIDYIHKIDGRNYQSIYGNFEGDVIIRNSLNDSDYRVFNESTVRGSLTIENNVLVTTNETSNYSSSQTMKIYGKFVNDGEFNNIDKIGGIGRRELVITFYDYVVNGELIEKAYFNDGAFNKIKGNLSIYSTNIYDYNLSDLDMFNYFENGTNEIVVNKDLTLAHYGGSLTTFNVKSGATLTIKSYVRGKFIVEEGAKLVVEEFGAYAGTLDVSGSGVLEVKNMGYRESVSFPNGKVILGADVRRASVKAKTIIMDYIHKIEGRDYQSIYGDFEGDVIIRNSLNDSDYRVFNESTVRGSLTIEDNVLVTTNETSNYSSSQTMEVYGKFVNNGEFNNIDKIGGLGRRSLVVNFYDYVVDGELVQKAYFNDGAFDKIKGSLSIYSTNIYDYNLSDIDIFKRFENNADALIIDKDYTLGSYSGYDQNIVIKSGSNLRVKSYVAGDFTIENGAKVIIDSFGPYSRDLNILGDGIIEIKNSQGLDNINFDNGTILFSGFNAGSRYSVTAKNIEFNKLYNEQDFQYIRSRILNGNIVIKDSQFNNYVYFGYQNFKINGVLKIENDVLFSIGRSDYQNLEVNGLLNNNGLITDKILVRGDYSGRITIKLNDNSEKGINANLNELGNYDISGDIWLNGVKVEDL